MQRSFVPGRNVGLLTLGAGRVRWVVWAANSGLQALCIFCLFRASNLCVHLTIAVIDPKFMFGGQVQSSTWREWVQGVLCRRGLGVEFNIRPLTKLFLPKLGVMSESIECKSMASDIDCLCIPGQFVANPLTRDCGNWWLGRCTHRKWIKFCLYLWRCFWNIVNNVCSVFTSYYFLTRGGTQAKFGLGIALGTGLILFSSFAYFADGGYELPPFVAAFAIIAVLVWKCGWLYRIDV